MAKSMLVLGRTTVVLALFAAMAGLAGSSAQARVFIGVGIPLYGPGFYPPPVYYPPPPVYYAPPPPPVYYAPPPPVYYAPPPPVYYTPPQSYAPAPDLAPARIGRANAGQAGAGQACYAGAYVCPMDRPVASGGSCYCAGNGGQKVWGRAN